MRALTECRYADSYKATREPKCGCLKCWRKWSDAQRDEASKLRAEVERLKTALLKLANEAQSFRSMADVHTHGYTNMAVLELRIREARAALATEPVPVTFTKEQCRRMADLEEGHDVTAGCTTEPAAPEVKRAGHTLYVDRDEAVAYNAKAIREMLRPGNVEPTTPKHAEDCARTLKHWRACDCGATPPVEGGE